MYQTQLRHIKHRKISFVQTAASDLVPVYVFEILRANFGGNLQDHSNKPNKVCIFVHLQLYTLLTILNVSASAYAYS